MVNLSASPIRRLEGITYWVIENPEVISDFINTEVRQEWEADARSEHRDPRHDPWLKALSKRKWHLEIMGMSQIKLNTDIMNYVDPGRNYVFSQSLDKRSSELRQAIKLGGVAMPPLVVTKEDNQLVDGYCRYNTLKSMNVTKVYAYVGTVWFTRRMGKKKIPRGRANDTIQDLFEDGMLGSQGWHKSRPRKKKTST